MEAKVNLSSWLGDHNQRCPTSSVWNPLPEQQGIGCRHPWISACVTSLFQYYGCPGSLPAKHIVPLIYADPAKRLLKVHIRVLPTFHYSKLSRARSQSIAGSQCSPSNSICEVTIGPARESQLYHVETDKRFNQILILPVVSCLQERWTQL